MATPDSDRSTDSDMWTKDAVADRTQMFFQRTAGLTPNQWVSDTVTLARVVDVDDEGKVIGTRIVRAYPGGPVAADRERSMLWEALQDSRDERRPRN